MTQTPFDPLALWRDMLSQWDKGFKELAGKNVAPPEFMATLMGRYLSAMNMPSRADLAMLNERLHRIESQLARLLAEQSTTGPGEPHGGKTAARAEQGQHTAPPNGPASAGTDTRAAGPPEATRRSSPRRGARKKKS